MRQTSLVDGQVVALSVDDLRTAVRTRLADTILAIHGTKAEAILARTLFAIAVHSLECWLLVQVPAEKGKGRIKNCHHHLERGLKRSVSKDYPTYQALSMDWRKQKMLTAAAKHNRSLQLFLDDLPSG